MSFCLPKEFADKFISALKEGKIDPEKLGEFSSPERRKFFEGIVGPEDAQQVNALFEAKLLVKNKQAGMIAWAKKVGGISEPVRRDIITRIENLNAKEVLDPKSEEQFLHDLVGMKLGTDVTYKEAKVISELANTVTETKDKILPTEPIGSQARLNYGAAKVALLNFTNEIKLENAKTSIKQTVKDLKTAPLGTTIEGVSKLAGTAKGIKASLDDSAIFRQGWKTVFTNPVIWERNAIQSFKDIAKQLGKKAVDEEVTNGIKADIFSRPNALDGTYQRMKLDIGTGEEAFPTTIPERIPLFGRLYKASEVAYGGFLMRMRADIADKFIEVGRKNGVDFGDKLEIESAGRLVNSLTGRGSLGAFEKVGKQVNTIFFSPKNIKANLDFLTVHAMDKMSSYARKQAAVNLLKVASGTALILAVADALHPGSVEKDSRSADFGKIKIGDTRFDVSGGMGSLITLASRIVTSSTKSSTSGKVTKLNTGKFGMPTTGDVVFNFMENKYSPLFSVLKQIRDQKDFNGEKPTIEGLAKDLLVPLPLTNAQEAMKDKKAAPLLAIIIADALGIATNTYGPNK